jgi:exodeoxyribonuclease VIII
MSVELKVFGGAYFPKDKALKKHPNLKPLATAVNASTKAIAEAVIFGKLAAEQPEHIDDYFKVKIWEHREDLPCPDLDVFSPKFFDSVAVWNVNAGEPAAAPQPESDEKADWEDNKAQEEIKTVARLDQASRAACLALFGPVPGITTAQYGQIVDLQKMMNPVMPANLQKLWGKKPARWHWHQNGRSSYSLGSVRTQKSLHNGRTLKSRSPNGLTPLQTSDRRLPPLPKKIAQIPAQP